MKTQNTLFKKVILLFISIFIPLTLFSVLTLNLSNRRLKNQILHSIDSNNSSYTSQLDSSLGNVYLNSYKLINQSNFRRFSATFSTLSRYDRDSQAMLLREQISDQCVISPFVESAHIYFKNHKIAYSSYGYKYGSFQELSVRELTALRKLHKKTGHMRYGINPLTGKNSLMFYVSANSSYDYCATFVLSQKELENYLLTNASYENERYLFTVGDSFSTDNFDFRLPDSVLPDADGNSYAIVKLNGQKYYAFSYELPSLSAHYTRFIPTHSLLKNVDKTPFLITVFFLFVTASCILFFAGIYRMVHQPLVHLTNAFEEIEKGNFKVTITDFQNADFAYLYQAFNDMTQKLDRMIERNYNQKMLLQKAELKQLQAQINPHFLYNSFFMLQRMIKMELMDEAQEMANALGIYFRYLTRNSMDQVTLAEEYEHAKTYAYIQGLRFSGRIRIDFAELPAQFAKLPIPKLIIQPILENAFNYGLHNKISDGILNIRFSVSGAEGEILTIVVEENGEELTDEALRTLQNRLETAKTDSADFEMTGLLNIQRRLAIFSNNSDSLHVSRSELGGLCVSVTLKNNFTEVL